MIFSSAYRVNGCLELKFNRPPATRQTRLQVVKQAPPLRVVRAFRGDGGSALAHLHNISGGVLGGDYLELTVRLGPQARVQLTTPGATRVYRHSPDRPEAIQRNFFDVGPGGLLEYLPDPLIPFAQARYRQTTQIHLADDAGLFWWEIVAPGREAYNELFAYDNLEMTVDIKANDYPIAIERMRLQPAIRPLSSPTRLGIYPYFATFYICRAGQPDTVWRTLEQELTTLAQPHPLGREMVWAVSALPRDGLIIRVLARTGRAIQAKLLALWQFAKTRLYNEPAIPPRKLY